MLRHLALQLIYDARWRIRFDDRDHLVILLRLQVSHEPWYGHLPTGNPDSDEITLTKAFKHSANTDPVCFTLYYKIPSFRRSRSDFPDGTRNCSEVGCVVWS